MLIRLGYACVSETLDHVTSSSTYTYTNFLKEQDYKKLDQIIKSNLEDLKKILLYNKKNNIHFYRLSSKIIPLATKKEVEFDYIKKYQKEYREISKIMKDTNMRVDFHPDQFCVLNSVKKEVVESTAESLEYHYQLLDAFGIKNKILVLHIGSNTFGKEKSLQRFINNFRKLPEHIQKCIAVENDDKIFTVEDCLYLNKILGIPIVLDYHHHLCNHDNDELFSYIDKIFKTWKEKTPKMHFSSPKNKTKKEFRSHHDYIDVESFLTFLSSLKKYSKIDCLDIMIEAKKKDEALFRLIRNLKYSSSYSFIDDTSFDI